MDEDSSKAWETFTRHLHLTFELEVGGADFELARSYDISAQGPFDRHSLLSYMEINECYLAQPKCTGVVQRLQLNGLANAVNGYFNTGLHCGSSTRPGRSHLTYSFAEWRCVLPVRPAITVKSSRISKLSEITLERATLIVKGIDAFLHLPHSDRLCLASLAPPTLYL